MTIATVTSVQKRQNYLFTPENLEIEVCASSGMQFHVCQNLDEALIPCLMAVISSTVHYSRYLEIYNLLDPVFSIFGQ